MYYTSTLMLFNLNFIDLPLIGQEIGHF